MLAITPGRVRSYATFLSPARGARGEYRFSFQDLVLLRTVMGLVAARVPPVRVKRSLKKLRERLPRGRPLSSVRISTDGKDVAVREDGSLWNPDSGQVLFDFGVADLATAAAPVARRNAAEARASERALDADAWYDLGCDLEAVAPAEARDAYERAVALDPSHADAHVNLGRLLHAGGEVAAAESHYRVALAGSPAHPTASFNLAVALEDLGRLDEAIAAYERAVEADPLHPDAHFNLARLLEKAGRKAAALRHLNAYRKLGAKPR